MSDEQLLQSGSLPEPATKSQLFQSGRFSSIPKRILSNNHLSSHAKLVYSALVDHLNKDDCCVFPKQNTVAQETGLKVRVVKRAIGELKKIGLIWTRSRYHTSSLYFFHPNPEQVLPAENDTEACGTTRGLTSVPPVVPLQYHPWSHFGDTGGTKVGPPVVQQEPPQGTTSLEPPHSTTSFQPPHSPAASSGGESKQHLPSLLQEEGQGADLEADSFPRAKEPDHPEAPSHGIPAQSNGKPSAPPDDLAFSDPVFNQLFTKWKRSIGPVGLNSDQLAKFCTIFLRQRQKSGVEPNVNRLILGAGKQDLKFHQVFKQSGDTFAWIELQQQPLPTRARGGRGHACSEQRAEAIYMAYPKHVGKAPAVREIMKAADKLRKECQIPDPAEFLLDRTRLYAASWIGRDRAERKYIPKPENWFKDGRYADDESEWQSAPKDRLGKVVDRVITVSDPPEEKPSAADNYEWYEELTGTPFEPAERRQKGQ